MTEVISSCRICHSPDLHPLKLREMMYGSREPFDYMECGTCGCIQIACIPADMSRHYPADYYSLTHRAEAPQTAAQRAKLAVKTLLLRQRPVRRIWLKLGSTREWLSHHPLAARVVARLDDPDARILDIGSGTGQMLRGLRALGYCNATGVDPFLAADILHDGSVLVRKQQIVDVAEPADLILLTHSLEHMPDQHQVMSEINRLLAPGGTALISIPLTGGEAWRTYRENWVQLDPPRHFFIHSRESFRRLVEDSGLAIHDLVYDSTAFQFVGSELYARDLPLYDSQSPGDRGQAEFPEAERQAFSARATAANAAEDGDQITAVIGRP